MIGTRSQNKMKSSKTRENENNVDLGRMKKRALTFFSPMRMMHSDGAFNGISSKRPNSGYQATQGRNWASRNGSNRRLLTTLMILSKLRIYIMPDRRVCFAGRIPKGIYMPRSSWLQHKILERMALWYLPCLELQGNAYSLDNTCYTRKENKFLKQLGSN